MNKIDFMTTVKIQNNPLGFDGVVADVRVRLEKKATAKLKAEILKVLPEMKPADIHTYGSMNERRKAYNEALLEVTAKLNELFNEKEK